MRDSKKANMVAANAPRRTLVTRGSGLEGKAQL
jgi:hypothetical protein